MIILLINGSLKRVQEPQARLQSVSVSDRAFFNYFNEALQGFIQVERGENREGIARMQRSIAGLPIAGIQIGRPALFYMLATAQLIAGQPEAGLVSVQEILPLLENSNQYWLSGFYQLKGKLLVNKYHATVSGQELNEEILFSSIQEAETCFLKAIEVAQRQGAKSWELKAAINLARLWQQQGKKDAARQMLGAIYGWFTEGFDALDLIEAKALLVDLENSHESILN
jgi:predicted ATPase